MKSVLWWMSRNLYNKKKKKMKSEYLVNIYPKGQNLWTIVKSMHCPAIQI